MSGKKLLTSLSSKVVKSVPTLKFSDEGSNLNDVIIGDMAESLSAFGKLDRNTGGWKNKVVTLVDDVTVEIAEPLVPMIDIDGLTVFDMLVKAGRSGAKEVIRKVGAAAALAWAKAKVPEETHEYDTTTVVVSAVIFEVMRAQGWRQRGLLWLSPAWMFPSYKLPYGSILAEAQAALDDATLGVA